MTHTMLLLADGFVVGVAVVTVGWQIVGLVRRRRRVSAVARSKGISRAAAAAWIDVQRPLR